MLSLPVLATAARTPSHLVCVLGLRGIVPSDAGADHVKQGSISGHKRNSKLRERLAKLVVHRPRLPRSRRGPSMNTQMSSASLEKAVEDGISADLDLLQALRRGSDRVSFYVRHASHSNSCLPPARY